MVNRGANTKSECLPGSTGEPALPREAVTVNNSCDDGTNNISKVKVHPNSLVLPFLTLKIE